MKYLLLYTVFLLILGCAANQPKVGIFQYLSDSNTVRLNMAIDAGEDLNQQDPNGRTILHLSIRYAPHLFEDILRAKPNLNIQDNNGLTPLHIAALYKPSFISKLLVAGADSSLLSGENFKCKVGALEYYASLQTAVAVASSCYRQDALKEFRRFAIDTEAWNAAKQLGTMQAYKDYLSLISKPMFRDQAISALQEAVSKWKQDTKAKSLCETKETGWYYVAGQCDKNLAHGNGTAITIENEKFVGAFENGWRKRGIYSQDSIVIYDGDYHNGQRQGYGICRYEGEMEECRTYQGRRIDTLYKQREYMMANFSHLTGQMEQLRGTVAKATGQQKSPKRNALAVLLDLTSEDDTKRTTAQIETALGIFRLISEAGN